MKLQQLRYLLEIVRHHNHVTSAAEALHTSQPGVSKQIQRLEDELGFMIFVRTRNRIAGLSEPGKEVVEIAQRMLVEAENLKALRDEFFSRDSGLLAVASTHTHARYILPAIIERLAARYPKVRLTLRQGNPTQICEMIEAGEADVAIGTESVKVFPDLVKLPCFRLSRTIVTKVGHPLLRVKKPTLQQIAQYPIITHDPASSGRWQIVSVFEKAGINVNVISSAVDADVCKTYAERGLAIAIIASVAFDQKRDTNLRAITAGNLFEQTVTFIRLRQNTYLRGYLLFFIRSLASTLSNDVIRGIVRGDMTPSTACLSELPSLSKDGLLSI